MPYRAGQRISSAIRHAHPSPSVISHPPTGAPGRRGKLSYMGGCGGLLDPSTAIRAAVLADSRVRSVDLVGSRASGTATELSDWDYRIASSDPTAIAAVLPVHRDLGAAVIARLQAAGLLPAGQL